MTNRALMKLREKAGLTQRQVADVLGVTDQTVSNWENGVRQMKLTIKQTSLLCNLLGCSLDELLEQEDSCNL
jgi:transcriptional regulator with XRE-family HTH domain